MRRRLLLLPNEAGRQCRMIHTVHPHRCPYIPEKKESVFSKFSDQTSEGRGVSGTRSCLVSGPSLRLGPSRNSSPSQDQNGGYTLDTIALRATKRLFENCRTRPLTRSNRKGFFLKRFVGCYYCLQAFRLQQFGDMVAHQLRVVSNEGIQLDESSVTIGLYKSSTFVSRLQTTMSSNLLLG